MPVKIKEIISTISSKLKAADQKTLYGIFGGVLFFIFLLDYFLIMGPQIKTLTKLTPKISQLRGDIERTETNLLRLNEYRKQIKEYVVKIESLESQINRREELPLVLAKISRIAHKSNVKINQIMPRTDDQEFLFEKNEKSFYTFPILIEAKSSYHDFGDFINTLENDNTFFQPDAFVVSRIKGSDENNIKLTVTAVVHEEIVE
ncbi:MAG: Tfp pilus assembly protein PilO [Candidatus Omnitrophota bacterium]|jgi:Tfp pilus assembly protein PilO